MTSERFAKEDEMATATINPADVANEDAIEALARLVAINADLTARIAAIPAGTRITLADGKTLSAADVAKLWDKVKFVVTTATYGPGYGGSFDYASGTSYIRDKTVNGWDDFPSGGEFITLHELIHSSAQGEAVRQAMWTKYYNENKHKPGYDTVYYLAPEFSEVEEYCYFGARAIMRQLGIPDFEGEFEHGYDYDDLKE
jgi:hypothetical protein